MEKKLLPYLVVISGLSVTLSAAFYSITGLGKMFAGASMQVMIMVGSLEIAKLVLASLIYQYWKDISNWLRFYYIIAVFVLMAITSGGIYGYLSAAYSETKNKMTNIDKRIEVLDTKRSMFSEKLASYQVEKDMNNERINQLTEGLSNNKIQYKDRETGQIITTTSSSNRKAFEKQLESAQQRRDVINENITAMTDSISNIDIKKLEIETNSDIASEIGPLKYIAELTGRTIDQVVNWFILALMFVFDPLAVSLIIGANMIFSKISSEKEKEKIAENIDEKIAEFKKKEDEFKEFEKNYSDKLNDIENREKEIEKIKQEIESKKSQLDESNTEMSESIKNERRRLQNIEYDLTEERAKFKEERDKYKHIVENLESEKQKIEEEKKKLEFQKQDLKRLDDEIKKWESTHWKMRRGKYPESAIVNEKK